MSKQVSVMVRIRPATHEKLKAIVAAKDGWTMTQATDTAIDRFIESERVPFPIKGGAMDKGRRERKRSA